MNCVRAKALKENCYPIPGGEGGREDNEKSPVEVPLKLRTNRRGIRREEVKVERRLIFARRTMRLRWSEGWLDEQRKWTRWLELVVPEEVGKTGPRGIMPSPGLRSRIMSVS